MTGLTFEVTNCILNANQSFITAPSFSGWHQDRIREANTSTIHGLLVVIFFFQSKFSPRSGCAAVFRKTPDWLSLAARAWARDQNSFHSTRRRKA